jgi:ankyrin repeat protein
MAEPESSQNGAADPPKRKWARFLLLVILPLFLFACLAGYARLRVEATDLAIETAIESRNLDRVRWLLRINPSLVRAKGQSSNVAFSEHPILFGAVETDNPEMIALLISKGASLTALDEWRRSPLAAALATRKAKAVEALLQRGAPIDSSALVGAASWRGSAYLELFLNRGADPNGQDPMGRTPLVTAAEADSLEAVKLLLARGADPKLADGTRLTALHAWAGLGHELELGQLLLARGADPNAKDYGGATPLFFAASAGSTEKMKLLLAHGADPNVKDLQGFTALSNAVRSDREAAVALLLEKGADPNLDPRTLSIAKGTRPRRAAAPSPKIIEMLIAHGAK